MSIYININNFKKAMFLNGFITVDLSKKTGVSQTYLSQIINRKKEPSPKMAKRIADALGVEIEDIFEFDVKEEVR